MSDRKKNTKKQVSSAGQKSSVSRTASSDSNALPGYFPPVSPSILEIGAEGFTHIFHQPSVFPGNESPAASPAKSPSRSTAVSKPGKTVSSAKSAAPKPVSTTKSAVVKPVKASTPGKADVGAKETTYQMMSADAIQRRRRRGPFDKDSYLKSLFDPKSTAAVVYTDRWTGQKVAIRRS